MFAMKRTLVLWATCALLLTSVTAFAGNHSSYLGVMLQDINSSMAKALQMENNGGVLVNEVIDDSPADEAGFEDGDVVLEFNGDEISNHKALTKAVRNTSVGDKVMIKVLRRGKTKKLEVVIGERTEKDSIVGFGSGDGDQSFPMGNDFEGVIEDYEDFGGIFVMDRGFLGVGLDDLNQQLGEYFGAKDGKGTLINNVSEDSGAEKAGLKAGDVIVRLDDTEIDSSDDLHRAMAKTEPGQEVKIEVLRKGKTKKFDVILGEMSAKNVKRIEVFGDDDHFSVHAPRMMMKHLPHSCTPPSPHQMHRMAFPDGIQDDELKEVRESLRELKEELEELREELKK